MKDFDVVLAAVASLEVKMLVVCLSAMSSIILLCPSVMSLYIQILAVCIKSFWMILMLFATKVCINN